MTPPASPSLPHSRWRVRENVTQLSVSHSVAAEAISVLRVAADVNLTRNRAVHVARPTLRQRVTMRQDWPQVICFLFVLLVAAVFLGWVSSQLVTRLTPAPMFAAALPGVLFAAATGGAARFAMQSARRRDDARRTAVLPALLLLAGAFAAAAAWVSIWLVLTSGTPAWAAVVFALGLSLAVTVSLMTCSAAPSSPIPNIATEAADRPVARQPPRRLRAKHKQARSKLEDHRSRWLTVAHGYAVTISGPGRPQEILASLLTDCTEGLPMTGLDPFDALILSSLRNYHPGSLAANLDVISATLIFRSENSIVASL